MKFYTTAEPFIYLEKNRLINQVSEEGVAPLDPVHKAGGVWCKSTWASAVALSGIPAGLWTGDGDVITDGVLSGVNNWPDVIEYDHDEEGNQVGEGRVVATYPDAFRLEEGKDYYLAENGGLTDVPNAFRIGKALSDTQFAVNIVPNIGKWKSLDGNDGISAEVVVGEQMLTFKDGLLVGIE